ncbi:MAG: hypothetical protein JJU11_06225 [Candidatus Sumerlaeia bacterium]|nr:hypothetical protein [Candidatus Sumerlaeia bacterium]
MKSKSIIWMLGAHAALLLVASMNYSIVSWIWGRIDWTWNYFEYSHRTGWGTPYQSDYTLVVVLTYLTAFFLGLIAHGMACKRAGGMLNIIAMVLCTLGLISFAMEGSHWLWEHHLSWIAISPAASLLLAVISIVQLSRGARPIPESTPALPPASA